MYADGGNAHVLKLLGQLDDGLVGLVVAEACLDGDGQRGVAHHRGGDSEQFGYVAQHARAGAFARHFAHGAAPVEVDEVGLGLLHHVEALQERPFLAAEDLDADRALCLVEAHFAEALFGVADEGLGGDELADEHVGAMLLAQGAEGLVGHVVHRREEEGKIAQFDVFYLRHRQYFVVLCVSGNGGAKVHKKSHPSRDRAFNTGARDGANATKQP